MDLVEIFIRLFYACAISVCGMVFIIGLGANSFHVRRSKLAKGEQFEEHKKYGRLSLQSALWSLPVLAAVVATIPWVARWLVSR